MDYKKLMQQYYGTQDTLIGGHTWDGKGKGKKPEA
jgi:hypothetical protein